MKPSIVWTALFLLLLSSSALSAIPTNSMKIYAVTGDGGAISAALTLKVLPNGTGKVWSSVDPLVGTSTQNAERTALLVAKNYSNQAMQYDYLFDINSNASLVEGPSAGAAMATLLISSLQDRQFPQNVGLTGTISESGEVGAVGGVFEKSREAARTGIQLFLIPKGESKQVIRESGKIESIDLRQYALARWKMKVVEVSTIDDVLKLAFSDIDSIDVNAAQNASSQTPEFVPTAIPFAPPLKPMQSLTRQYLKESIQLISIARNSLSTTLLDDTELISALLNSLNEAEDTLNQSQVLFDQNYFYSSANFAFLSSVNAQLIQDVAQNPALLQPDSALFDSKLSMLGNGIQDLKGLLDQGVPVDGIEWYVGAQERLSWAELNYEKLTQEKDVIISVENGQVTSGTADQFQKVQDFEFAQSWVNISKQFHSIGKNSSKKVVLDDFLKEQSQQQIVQAENDLAAAQLGNAEDIQRRLDAAKLEFENQWYVSSAFDSASAIALTHAQLDSDGKDLSTLQEMLSAKINATQKRITASKNPLVWSNLYLDHARFFLEQAKFYESHSQNSSAVSSLKSGLGLAYLSDGVLDIAEQSYDHYNSIPESQYVQPGAFATINISPNGNPGAFIAQTGFLVLLLIVVALLGVIAIVVFSQHLDQKKRYALPAQLDELQRQRMELDSLKTSGKLDESTFSMRVKEIESRQSQLESDRKIKSANLIALDRLRAELTALERALRELKNHYREGMVVEEDYNQAMKDLLEKMGHIQRKITERKSPSTAMNTQPMNIVI